MMISTRRFGRIDVAVLRRRDALEIVLQAIAARRHLLVCFANAHTINTARRYHVFAQALRHALVLNDGIGVDLASRWLYGTGFPDNLNGTDLTPALLSSLPEGTRVFLLGAPPGVAARAADIMASRHPHLDVVGTEHGFFSEAQEADLNSRIERSGTQLVLAAMGHPRQEIWASRNIEAFGATVMCVGALLDFYAGTAIRAPSWVRRARAEWVYRLLREPRRLARRYLIGNGAFLSSLPFAKRYAASVSVDRIAKGGAEQG